VLDICTQRAGGGGGQRNEETIELRTLRTENCKDCELSPEWLRQLDTFFLLGIQKHAEKYASL
jgi:hypothetical protein